MFVLLLLAVVFSHGVSAIQPTLSEERVVFQTSFGDIEMGFYPEVAPKSVAHIFRLVELGAYNTNHFFRVDKAFVAQVADCGGGRQVPLNPEQQAEEDKRLPLELDEDVKHHAGILSMARHDDPNSNGSSFSILLGDAAHLDMHYTIFGVVTAGMDTLRKMEMVETRTEGIFVMPVERITIQSTYIKTAKKSSGACEEDLQQLQQRFTAQEVELQRVRRKCLPGT
ncbi:hypothetical protein BSKO_01685 [Bryopsis sp. KO-2023]|nr:hypothetical protein BSKO_01685 [Bryopsis sp. KO-2023]